MFTGAPLICGGLVTVRAQGVVWCNRHWVLRVILLQWAMTRLTGHAFFGIFSCIRVKTCCMAFKAGSGRALLYPILLEDRRRESLGMQCAGPGCMNIRMAVCTCFRTCITWLWCNCGSGCSCCGLGSRRGLSHADRRPKYHANHKNQGKCDPNWFSKA